MRYWVRSGGVATESEREEQVGTMKVRVNATPGIAGSLMGGLNLRRSGSTTSVASAEGLACLNELASNAGFLSPLCKG